MIDINVDMNKLQKGKCLPFMRLVVPLMMKIKVDNQEGFKNLLKKATIYVSEEKKTVAVVERLAECEKRKPLKAVSKVTEGDTFDEETGIYLTLVKYLTQWNNTRLNRYFTLRVPKLEREAYPEVILNTLKEQKVKNPDEVLKKMQSEIRHKVEKEIALEVILKLTGLNKDGLTSIINKIKKESSKK